jgi:transcriptional regulator with XRE-family HTH domain
MEKKTEKILQNIRKTRIEKKMSILKLAIEVGISHSHLYYIESKRVVPSVEVLVKIAQALQVDIKELLD